MVLFNLLNKVLTSNSTDQTSAMKSRFSPWLLPIVYPLGCSVVMPFYFGKIEVIGQHHLPREGPVILAPTHRSRWDALLVPYATGRWVTGRDLRFMVTSDEMTGLQGWLIRRLGGFPVNTKSPAISSLRFGVEVLQNGEMLVIFPEGGIFRDYDIHPLRPGLARLAVQAETSKPGLGIKVVPISLVYSDPYQSWGSNVRIQIGAPLHVEKYCNDGSNSKQNATRLTADLEAAIGALHSLETSNATTPMHENTAIS